MLDKTRKQKKSYVLLIICKRKTLKKQKQKNQDVKLIISPLCFYCLEKSKKECLKKCFKQGKKVKNE